MSDYWLGVSIDQKQHVDLEMIYTFTDAMDEQQMYKLSKTNFVLYKRRTTAEQDGNSNLFDPENGGVSQVTPMRLFFPGCTPG